MHGGGERAIYIKSKANRQKQNNNQQRETPDGNVVLVSRVHETECNRSDRKYSEHAHVSAGRGNLGRQRDGAEVDK